MLLNLNKKFVALDGIEAKEDLTIGQVLSQAIASVRGNLNPLKSMPWAYALYKNESVELDQVDLKLLQEFVKSLDKLTPLASYQILNEITKLIGN